MTKLTNISKDYYSPLKIFSEHFLPKKIYEYIYPNKYGSILTEDDKFVDGKFFLGSFQPFAEMAKDFTNTFRPYKTVRHAAKEFLQPLQGVGNILKGLSILALTALTAVIYIPVLLVASVVFLTQQDIGATKKFVDTMLTTPVLKISAWLVDGISSIVRGVTQLLFTPLLPLKFLCRAAITLFTGWQKLENDRGIKKLLKQYSSANKIYKGITSAIMHKKYEKAIKQGRKVPYDYEMWPKNIVEILSYKEPKGFLTPELLHFFDTERYQNVLTPEQRFLFSKELLRFNPHENKEEIKQLLKLNHLYVNRAKIVLLMAKRHESLFAERGIKDIIPQIARYTQCEPLIPSAHLVNVIPEK